MKRILVGVLALAAFAILSCSSTTTSSLASLASNPLVSSLTSGLGLNTTQAVGGAGALLGSAQEKLSTDDWKKVSDAVPGSNDLVTQAKSLGGVTGKFGDVSNMGASGGTFSKLGLSNDQVSQMVPVLTNYVSKAAGPQVGGLLAGVLK